MEKKIEQKFAAWCKASGHRVIKFEDPGKNDAPDRLVLTEIGIAIFIEFKQPGEFPRAGQLRYMIDLNKRGFLAIWTQQCGVATGTVRAVTTSKNPHNFVTAMCRNQVGLLSAELNDLQS